MLTKIAPKRRSLKDVLRTNTANLKKGVFTLAKKTKTPKKPAKKLTKAQKELNKAHRKHVIMGIGLLLVFVSICYSTSVTLTLVDSKVSLLAIAPQVIFAGYIILKAFSKLYK